MRVRLRDLPGAEELYDLYAVPHDHQLYGYGHGLRVDVTVPLGVYALARQPMQRAAWIADLSCGNADIANRIARDHGNTDLWLGDFAQDPGYDYHGPIEQTLGQLGDHLHGLDIDLLDLFICSETIEHLDDPDQVLADIRRISRQLLLSTPIGETDAGNREHLWGWDQDGVADMLHIAGWDIATAQRIDVVLPDTYSYQVWLVR